ncbi:unnamed protein product [Euphydryas editha]|uniref:Uncharacterized protein n=1 Tax=Euphydryas editha TaxID=104508 RepID=A0AAU9TW60_EUPED|nr:unnamed protein product [Euphydryas editha]
MSDSASVTSKVSTSLRKRVLKRTATSATVTPPPSTSEKQPDPNNITETAVVHVDTISEPQTSDLEDIETSSLSSAASTSSRRVSLLYMSPSRGTGVHMDLVPGVANDLLQKGKEALEMAVNMKREVKTTVYESLQGLYETVLSLSDSRNRHKCSLERERASHAQELMRVERAHNKEICALKQTLLTSLTAAHSDISETLKETRAVRSWLGYETEEPFRRIKEVRELQTQLEAKLCSLAKLASSQGTQETAPTVEKQLGESIKSVSDRIGSLSTRMEYLSDDLEQAKSMLAEKIENIPRLQDEASQEKPDMIWTNEFQQINNKIDYITKLQETHIQDLQHSAQTDLTDLRSCPRSCAQ